MKKQFIIGYIAGAITFGAIGALAAGLLANPNPFPIELNGESVSMEGYNIEGSTYFKLRDIAAVVGGFDVDFHDNTIQLSKDGYVYNNTPNTITVDDSMISYFAEYGIRIPAFSEASVGTDEFVSDFVFYYYTGLGDPTGSSYANGRFSWPEQTIKDQYKLLFGYDMPDYRPSEGSVTYNNGIYKISVSDYGDIMYVFENAVNDGNDTCLNYRMNDSSNTYLGTVTFRLSPADNANGYILKSKTVSQ